MPRARPVSSKNSSCACACGAGGDKEAERHIQSMHYGHLRYGRDGRRLRTRTHFHRTAKHLQDTERGQGCTYVATERLVINHTERLAPRNKPSLPNNSSKRRLIAPPPLNKWWLSNAAMQARRDRPSSFVNLPGAVVAELRDLRLALAHVRGKDPGVLAGGPGAPAEARSHHHHPHTRFRRTTRPSRCAGGSRGGARSRCRTA